MTSEQTFSLVQWCNTNNGFLIGMLTLIYVIATILIFVSNQRSASAMNKNNILQSKIQKQNVDMQLFDERMNVYFEIKKYLCDDVVISWNNALTGNKACSQQISEVLFFKIKYLFKIEIYNQLTTINAYLIDISEKVDIFNKAYNELCKKDGVSMPNVLKLRNDYIAKYIYKELTESEKNEFKKFAENKVQKFRYKDNKIEVNFYDYFIEIEKLKDYFFNNLVTNFISDIAKEMPIDSFREIK